MEIRYNNRVKIENLHGLIVKLRSIVGDAKWVSTEEADLIAYGKDYQLITNTWMMDGINAGKPHVTIVQVLIEDNEKKNSLRIL